MTNSKIYNGGGVNYKKLYLKSILVLLKAFQRYDFGMWFIKIPLYKIFKPNIKLQEKREARYTALQIAKNQIVMLFILKSQIKAWLQSKEFKEKYIDTNHPCPPLLKPNSIPYDSIGAELAWELNLPLPHNYKLIFLSNGASGVAAVFSFLGECGVSYAGMSFTPKDSYLQLYDFCQKKLPDSQNLFIALSFFAECIVPYPEFYDNFKQRKSKYHNDAVKLVNCITKKVPLLYVARDPIGRMRTIINHIYDYRKTPIMEYFNLSVNYEKLFVKPLYFGKVVSPSFVGLDGYDEVAFLYTRLLSDSLFNAFEDKVSEIHCIEFNDLMPEVAFNVFCELSNKFGFNKPINKEAFISRRSFCNGGAITTLPITLYAHSDDLDNMDKENLKSLNKKGGFSIIITLPHYITKEQRNFIDISNEIEQNIIIDEARILMLIDKDELTLLKQNDKLYNATINYLKGYVKSARANVTKIRNNLIKDSDILEYLRTHSDKRKFYKNIFDNELTYIKTHYPHFLDKWDMYNKFEKICVETDLT